MIDESSQPIAIVLTLKKIKYANLSLPISHELNSTNTAFILFKDPDARTFLSNVPYPGCSIVRASGQDVSIKRENIKCKYFILVITIFYKEAAWLLKIPEHN